MSHYLRRYKIHRDGIGFCLFFILLSIVLLHFNDILGDFAIFGSLWCLYFFRVPTRDTPTQEGLIISSADGKVVSVKEVIPPKEFGLGNAKRTRVSIFLNIFDVHINYIPISGKIKKVYYEKGHFFNAAKDKASEHNEKNALVIELPYGDGYDVGVVQIAGLIARRIRCDVRLGDNVSTGQYYGLIRFGSRQEIYLPPGVSASVKVGDRVLAAKTIVADIFAKQSSIGSVSDEVLIDEVKVL